MLKINLRFSYSNGALMILTSPLGIGSSKPHVKKEFTVSVIDQSKSLAFLALVSTNPILMEIFVRRHAKHCLILKKGKFLPTCTSSWKEEGMLIKMAQKFSHKVCSSFPKKFQRGISQIVNNVLKNFVLKIMKVIQLINDIQLSSKV